MGNSSGKPIVLTDQVNLNHFRLLRVVGKGAFGKVRIVERKDTGLTFALKYIRKDEVVRSESVRNIIRERRMLEHLNHPFLCNLRYSFQDIEYLYIVVDLMNGGDLRFHISRKTFTEEAVRFWIAELGCALRYIHKQGIVHRDVKPDNILLDSDGHVHLADFNVASEFTPNKPLTSKSGTLAYLAPEVYEGKGYSCEVDWWSLGVVFYECIYNKRPFEPRDHNHESLASLIKKADPTFPTTNPPVSMPCLHAVSSLLEKNRKQRIGASGWETFTDNPFFRAIDFDKLEEKEIEPIFKPSSDKTNFDATYDLEELLLEEAPLEARARRQKPREQLKEDATQQEIRADELHKMIETLFEPFNYQLVSENRPSAQSSPTTNESTIGRARTPTDPPRPASAQKSSGDDNNLRATLSGRSNTHMPSRNGSPPRGSPPIPTSKSTLPSSVAEACERNDYFERTNATTHNNATPNMDAPVSFSRPNPRSQQQQQQQGSKQNVSVSGGIRDVLADGGSRSDVPAQRRTTVGSQGDEKIPGMPKPSGMMGFLSRKKGRDRSPKAKERGVLGKEGARVVVSNS